MTGLEEADRRRATLRMSAAEHRELLAIALTATLAAGPPILDIYRAEIAVRHKEDRSPVTQADERAEAVILDILARETPEIACVAEESVARAGTSGAAPKRYWVIDPLDGTKGVHRAEWRIHGERGADRRPCAGLGRGVFAGARHRVGRRRAGQRSAALEAVEIFNRSRRDQVARHTVLIVLHSRSHADEDKPWRILRATSGGDTRGFGQFDQILPACRRREADLYPRFGTTMEMGHGG